LLLRRELRESYYLFAFSMRFSYLLCNRFYYHFCVEVLSHTKLFTPPIETHPSHFGGFFIADLTAFVFFEVLLQLKRYAQATIAASSAIKNNVSFGSPRVLILRSIQPPRPHFVIFEHSPGLYRSYLRSRN